MRILITGTESTGKSTLAAALSETLGWTWVPEYARLYLEENGKGYTQQDLLKIAKGHFKQVKKYKAEQPLILDTYLLNIKIWSLEKYGTCHPWISHQLERSVEEKLYDQVLLCTPDLTWIQDGLRENPKSANRLHQIFISELNCLRLDYLVVSGQGIQRTRSALAALGH